MEILWKSYGNHGFITSKARTEKPLGKPQGLAPACWASGRTSTTWTQPELRNTQKNRWTVEISVHTRSPTQVCHVWQRKEFPWRPPLASTSHPAAIAKWAANSWPHPPAGPKYAIRQDTQMDGGCCKRKQEINSWTQLNSVELSWTQLNSVERWILLNSLKLRQDDASFQAFQSLESRDNSDAMNSKARTFASLVLLCRQAFKRAEIICVSNHTNLQRKRATTCQFGRWELPLTVAT